MQKKRQNQAKILRTFRKIHRTSGALLFVFFFIISISGLLLGWKKHSGDLILSKSRQGISTDLKDWLPLDDLHTNAVKIFQDSISSTHSLALDRVDVKKDKGMVKFIFEEGYWGIQLDGATGKLLHIERRRGDFIEQLHDGSILDKFLDTGTGLIKLVYSTIMGISLFLFTATGFWLWLGPKRMRKAAARA
ncbi:PepSY domain-containing protein [Arenibacter sp. 6A1]|uniref:PepSY domain-containing protein n=1 Tax=Arenibacter sp. 6A1 TaxID=2720391 RepID=UPI001444F408|nr:PepSY-associated TM helix domain-containing protein [Arenibacter sp. 6A1]NKI26323.1 PepSY domain-containing protein [Arenibacter sp. 6A1]